MGRVDIPASKSQTIHALLIALFAKGVSTIHNPLICSDTQACIDFCEKVGARISQTRDSITIDSTDLSPRDDLEIDCKNSGTTLYFATALSCTLGVDVRFTGDEALQHRPAKPLLASLKDLGANLDPKAENAPYSVCGPLVGGHTSIRCMTGQFLTALLLAAPLARTDTTIDVHLLKEKTSVRMTEIWMEKQGIELHRDADMHHFTIPGGQTFHPFETNINGDFSIAAFFLCAAAITSSTITVNKIASNSSQPDRAIIDILKNMGCHIRSDGHSITLKAPARLKAVDVDLADTPDLLPALAVTACFASGPVRLYNIAHSLTKGTKERSSSIADGIRAIGGQVQVLHDSMVIYPITAFEGGTTVSSYGDPRMAMAMAVASLRCRKGLIVEDSECVDVTFPEFFDKFSTVTLTGGVNVQDSPYSSMP